MTRRRRKTSISIDAIRSGRGRATSSSNPRLIPIAILSGGLAPPGSREYSSNSSMTKRLEFCPQRLSPYRAWRRFAYQRAREIFTRARMYPFPVYLPFIGGAPSRSPRLFLLERTQGVYSRQTFHSRYPLFQFSFEFISR